VAGLNVGGENDDAAAVAVRRRMFFARLFCVAHNITRIRVKCATTVLPLPSIKHSCAPRSASLLKSVRSLLFWAWRYVRRRRMAAPTYCAAHLFSKRGSDGIKQINRNARVVLSRRKASRNNVVRQRFWYDLRADISVCLNVLQRSGAALVGMKRTSPLLPSPSLPLHQIMYDSVKNRKTAAASSRDGRVAFGSRNNGGGISV